MTNNSFLREELLDVQEKANELDTENIRLTKENQKYEIENKKLKSSISQLNNQLNQTVERKDFEELTNKYDQLETRYDNLDKNFKRLKKDNETLNNTYDNCLASYSNLETKFEQTKKENSELKNSINELKTLSAQTLKDASSKFDQITSQEKIISALEEENESLKTHLNYLKEQSKKNASIISCGDSFSIEGFNNSVSVPESMDIIVETKLRDCQNQLEETESKLTAKLDELKRQNEQSKLKDQEIESLKNEINSLEKQKTELEDNLEIELSKKTNELNNLNQELVKLREDYENLTNNFKFNENELNISKEEMIRMQEENKNQQLRIEELTIQSACKQEEFDNKLKQLNQQIELLRNEVETKSNLVTDLEAIKDQFNQELISLKEQTRLELENVISKYEIEKNETKLKNDEKEQKLKIELSDLELEKQSRIDELKKELESLRERYSQLQTSKDELFSQIESLDSKLIDLESENVRLKLEATKSIDEFEEAKKLSEDKLAAERNELEKQVKELKSALSNLRDENSLLIKKHQEEVFKLSETMNKKQEDTKMRLDLQATAKELQIKDEQIAQLVLEIEQRKELSHTYQIQIEQLKANEREKNHTIYMLKKANANELEKLMKEKEVEIKRLEADLKCTEDSFILERKTKERYYRELCNLEKRIEENNCPECSISGTLKSANQQLYRTNSNITVSSMNSLSSLNSFNSANSTQIQKIPNPRFQMEDEEGQFMTSIHLNEFRKRKTDNSGQDDFAKRMNILQQRNARVAPHLKTSYALEFQEQGTSLLNEKIKNSETFVVDLGDANSSSKTSRPTRNPISKTFSSELRLRRK